MSGLGWALLAVTTSCSDTELTVNRSQAPDVAFGAPADMEVVETGDVLVTTTAEDDLDDTEQLVFELRRSQGESLVTEIAAIEQDVVNWIVRDVPPGTITLVFQATDTDGNEASVERSFLAAPDGDGDGFLDHEYGGDDCDDARAEAYPEAEELCNDLDDDCDDDTDEGVDVPAWYYDADGDGYGDPDSGVDNCDAPNTDWVDNGDDCNDDDSALNPDTVWYADTDGDGFGTDSATTTSCEPPSGYAATDDDCDDDDVTVHPEAVESCNAIDDDCDGAIDDDDDAVEGTQAFYRDTDGDGWGTDDDTSAACEAPSGYVAADGDCDDGDAAVNPEATEVCDGLDNDCDRLVDDDDSDVDLSTGSVFYQDSDGDGYGAADIDQRFCDEPSGWSSSDSDCDDSDATVNPDTIWYADTDGDSYGDPASTTTSCDQPTAYVSDDTDCDDGDATLNPDTVWYGDGDGDGYGDPATTSTACEQPSDTVSDDTDCDDSDATVNPDTVWYIDADSDGYGTSDGTTASCEQPSGYESSSDDCQDADADVNPGATEVCNDGVDDDCDGLTDADDDSLDASTNTTWYADADGDSYGDPDATTDSCEQPTGYVADDQDCDDEDGSIHPAGEEICDGADNDCDTETDEDSATDVVTWYADTDGDGYGTPDDASASCSQPSGFDDDADDCNDSDATVNPAAAEACDGVDNDCDDDIDEDDASDAGTWYVDDDADGYGVADDSSTSCDQPTGTASLDGDCDDATADVNPAATEVCNDLDDDCDELVDDADDSLDSTTGTTWYADTDGDSYGDPDTSTATCVQPSGYADDADDCDDGSADVNPDASEVCDEIDNDCDELVDLDDDSLSDATTYFEDADGDGYGDSDSTAEACDVPTGYAADDGDCDDDDADANPDATEVANGTDDDCDGSTDEGVDCYYDFTYGQGELSSGASIFDFDAATEFTIEVRWMVTGSSGQRQRAISDQPAYATGWHLGIDGTELRYYGYPSGTSAQTHVTTPSVADGTWHDLALVHEFGALRVYYDGAEITTASSSYTGATTTDGTVNFGSIYDGGERFYGGLDALRVSDTALYTDTSYALPSWLEADAGTLGLWNFDDCGGTTVADASGNGYDITLTTDAGWATR